MRPPPSIASLGEVMQIAFVPPDFAVARDFWLGLGAGPFFALDHVALDQVRYRGAPTEIDFSMLLGYWGDLQIELIEQHNTAPSIYREWRDQSLSGVHHFCVLIDDMAAARAACAAIGGEVRQEALVPGGGEVIYVDTGGGPGTMVELLRPAPGTREAFAMMRESARGWDGADAVRRLG